MHNDWGDLYREHDEANPYRHIDSRFAPLHFAIHPGADSF